MALGQAVPLRPAAATGLGTGLALTGCVIALVNRFTVPRLHPSLAVLEPVTVCVPARDEASRLPDLIADLRAQVGVPRLRVLILDDGSSDGTAELARAAAGEDARITVLRSEDPPPPGWTGKAAACARLAVHAGATDALPAAFTGARAPGPAARVDADSGRPEFPAGDRLGPTSGKRTESAAREHQDAPAETPSGERRTSVVGSRAVVPSAPSVVVFLDADVRLAPQAIAAAVAELRRSGAAMVAPWPWQRSGSRAEALVQPLLCWSWASTLLVPFGNRSLRPSTVVSCGQFLVFDAPAYRAIGGHESVAGSPIEDLDIARALRRAGASTRVVAAGPLASTRMYRGATELEAGYTRWLWSAHGGSPTAATAVAVAAGAAYVLPPAAAVFGHGRLRRTGALGYAAAVAGRLLARRLETGAALRASDVSSALAHPIAVAVYQLLTLRSHRARRRGAVRWKGRPAVTTRS